MSANTKPSDLGWMLRIASPKGPVPTPVYLDPPGWTIAANSRYAVSCEARSTFPAPDAKVAKRLRKFLLTRREEIPCGIDVNELKKWAGGPAWMNKRMRCIRCTEGGHFVDDFCAECGTWIHDQYPPRYGKINGFAVNTALLSRAIEHFPTENRRVYLWVPTNEDPLLLAMSGHSAVVMGLRIPPEITLTYDSPDLILKQEKK